MLRKLSLLLGLAASLAATGAGAIPIANGDLVVVLQKSGVEVVVNIGSFGSSHSVDLSSASTSLGGLEGAKLVAIGVEEPGRTVEFGFGPLPQANLVFSSLSAPVVTDASIDLAMNATDTALASTAWFYLLRAVSSNVIQTSQSFSYQNTLGLGTDAVANNFSFSIAGLITGGALSIDVYSAVQGYGDFGGPPTQLGLLGSLTVSGNQLNYSFVPEPGTLLLLGAGLFGLAAFERRAGRA